jgi:hypothetical protein
MSAIVAARTRVCLAAVAISTLATTACAGSGRSAGTVTVPPASATASLDPAALARRYLTVLSTDLAGLVPIDSTCRSGVDACRAAIDRAGSIAAKVVADLQHLTAEPDAISTPVDDIRAQSRFVVTITTDFDSYGMPVDEAVRAYTAEYNTIEHDLAVLRSLV